MSYGMEKPEAVTAIQDMLAKWVASGSRVTVSDVSSSPEKKIKAIEFDDDGEETDDDELIRLVDEMIKGEFFRKDGREKQPGLLVLIENKVEENAVFRSGRKRKRGVKTESMICPSSLHFDPPDRQLNIHAMPYDIISDDPEAPRKCIQELKKNCRPFNIWGPRTTEEEIKDGQTTLVVVHNPYGDGTAAFGCFKTPPEAFGKEVWPSSVAGWESGPWFIADTTADSGDLVRGLMDLHAAGITEWKWYPVDSDGRKDSDRMSAFSEIAQEALYKWDHQIRSVQEWARDFFPGG